MEDIALIIIFGSFALFAALDFVISPRKLPAIRHWRARGLSFFVVNMSLALFAPLLWDGPLSEYRLLDASGLGTVGGALFGFLVLEMGIYAAHRALHGLPLLWRFGHQVHHSAERLDVFGAMMFHPMDTLLFALVTSVCLGVISGVTTEAAIIAGCAATVLAFFQHANLRTPRWLGYIVQRPEMHAMHHGRGLHAFNYADLPLIDMVFGTFRNPVEWEGETGYYDGASARVGEMLLGMDVTRPPAGAEDSASVVGLRESHG